jgi:hypothetical protein
MAEYRAHIIGTDGRFLKGGGIGLSNEDTAKEYARQLVDGHDVELWQDDRKIESFKHTRE